MSRSLFSSFLAFLAVSALGNAGCSHLAYQPSQVQYSDPAKAGIVLEEVSFESLDGTPLAGWFFPALLEKGEKARGTFVQFHGNAQNMTSHFISLYWVTHAGYNLLTFDYRGYGRSGSEPSQEGLNQDALAAIQYVQTKVPAPAGAQPDIILYGQSLGGAVLARAFADVKDRSRIRLVAIESSFHSYQAIARNMLSRNWVSFLFQPMAYVLMSDKYSPEDVISKISPTPLLVIHGDRDKTIPLSFGEKIFELAQEPKHFWLVKDGQHIDSMVRRGGRYREKLVELIEGKPRPFPRLPEE